MFEKQVIYMLFKLFRNKQKDGTCPKSFTKPIQQNDKMTKIFQNKDTKQRLQNNQMTGINTYLSMITLSTMIFIFQPNYIN